MQQKIITTAYGDFSTSEDGKFYSEDFRKLEIAHFTTKRDNRKLHLSSHELMQEAHDKIILSERRRKCGKGCPIRDIQKISQRDRAFAPKEKFNKILQIA